MRQRFRLYRRKKGGRYYIHDDVTGKQESLGTNDRATAVRVFHSKSEATKQPAVNLQIARAYLAAGDPQIATRNWQFVMEEMVKLKKGETQRRWQSAIKDKAFDTMRHLPVLETRPEHFLRVLETGKVSTNVYLRRIHNFALDMTWLPWPVIVKRQWPKVQFKDKRAITWEEHQAIVAREQNPERKAFYQLAWHLGASQTWLCLKLKILIGNTTSSVSRARKPVPLLSCALTATWRRSFAPSRQINPVGIVYEDSGRTGRRERSAAGGSRQHLGQPDIAAGAISQLRLEKPLLPRFGDRPHFRHFAALPRPPACVQPRKPQVCSSRIWSSR